MPRSVTADLVAVVVAEKQPEHALKKNISVWAQAD